MSLGPKRRFWTEAAVVTEDGGFTLTLDGRAVKTPAKAKILCPHEALMRSAAEEWLAQGEEIKPETMPVTKLINTAIDRVSLHHAAVVDEIAGYGETDLLCYRAAHPAALRARQDAAWDPWLDWAAQFGPRLTVAEGVMHVAQPAAAAQGLRDAAAARDAFALAALHELVSLSGSLVLGLAVAHGAATAEDAWAASRVDETWQAEQWGEDAEAAEAAALRQRAFLIAARSAAETR